MTRSRSTEPAWTRSRPCPVCGCDVAVPLIALDGFQLYLDSEPPRRVDVRQVQCRRCFCLYMNPVYAGDAVAELFREGGMSFRASPERVGEQARWLARRGRLEPGATVLDVGCSDGRFLEALPVHVRKLGVEVDGSAAERARERLAGQDATIVHGDVEAVTVNPGTITLYHVLEHLPDPVAVLAALRRRAVAATRLVVEVPVVERGETNDLVGFFTIQHTTHFSRRSLANCLRAGGWEPAEWTEAGDYNGCRVLAEPAGPAAAPRGDPGDVAAAHAVLASWHGAASDVSSRLAAVGDRCLVWGAGIHLEYLFHRTPLFHEDRSDEVNRTFAIVDSDPLKQGGAWRGIAVEAPTALERLAAEGLPLVVSSYDSQDEIRDAAVALGVREADVVRLYDRIEAY